MGELEFQMISLPTMSLTPETSSHHYLRSWSSCPRKQKGKWGLQSQYVQVRLLTNTKSYPLTNKMLQDVLQSISYSNLTKGSRFNFTLQLSCLARIKMRRTTLRLPYSELFGYLLQTQPHF